MLPLHNTRNFDSNKSTSDITGLKGFFTIVIISFYITGDEVLQPRYFVIHRDGQGEELLHENDVSSFLEEAEKDPLVAVIKSESVDQTGMMGITVLKPMKGKSNHFLLLRENDS